MAFLDKSSLIVDAVLTDKGREKLASNSFSIVKFALGDDEIDYTMYDESNSNGPNFYGISIENMPILESSTQSDTALKYKLITRPPSTTQLPEMGASVPETISLTGDGAMSPDYAMISPSTLRFDEDEDYIFELQDDSYVDIIVGDYAEQVKKVAHTVIFEQLTIDGEPVPKSAYQSVLFGKNKVPLPLKRSEQKLFADIYSIFIPVNKFGDVSVSVIRGQGEVYFKGQAGPTQLITGNQVYADNGILVSVEGAGIISLGLVTNKQSGPGNYGDDPKVPAGEGDVVFATVNNKNRSQISEAEKGGFKNLNIQANSKVLISYTKGRSQLQITQFVKAINAQKNTITLKSALSQAIPSSVTISTTEPEFDDIRPPIIGVSDVQDSNPFVGDPLDDKTTGDLTNLKDTVKGDENPPLPEPKTFGKAGGNSGPSFGNKGPGGKGGF